MITLSHASVNDIQLPSPRLGDINTWNTKHAIHLTMYNGSPGHANTYRYKPSENSFLLEFQNVTRLQINNLRYFFINVVGSGTDVTISQHLGSSWVGHIRMVDIESISDFKETYNVSLIFEGEKP